MRVSVLLTRQEIDALSRLSLSERRPPRDQAAYLIAEGLKQRGLLGEPTVAATPDAREREEATDGIAA